MGGRAVSGVADRVRAVGGPGRAEAEGAAAFCDRLLQGAVSRRLVMLGGIFQSGLSSTAGFFAAPLAARTTPDPQHSGAFGVVEDCAFIGCEVLDDTVVATNRMSGCIGESDDFLSIRRCIAACPAAPDAALARLRAAPRYDGSDFVQEVSAAEPFAWHDPEKPKHNIVVLDLGVKHNILRILSSLGCKTTVVPYRTTADDILALQPDGVVLSPGPGDPALLDGPVDTVNGLLGRVPIFGICIGHQVLARACGASTYKLKFGHRGANHPVRDDATGRVSITAQNHGYAVDPDGLSSNVEVSHVHLNDGTCEGLRHRELPAFTIQYHSEASPGPQDNRYLFERFLELVEEAAR